MLLPTEVWDGSLTTQLPTLPGVPFVVAVQLLEKAQAVVQLAVPEKAQVWYPSGTGMEFALLDCHIRNMVALKDRVIDVSLEASAKSGPSLVGGACPPAQGYEVSRPGVVVWLKLPVKVSVLINCTLKNFPLEALEYPVGELNFMPGVPLGELQLPVSLPYTKYGPAEQPVPLLKFAIVTCVYGVVVMDPPVGPVTLKVVVATGLFTLPPPADMVYW